MLIVYWKATGQVVDNHGINSALPLGPPDHIAYINTDARGIDRNELALLRLHDVHDAEVVERVLNQTYHVNTSINPPQVAFDGPIPEQEEERRRGEQRQMAAAHLRTISEQDAWSELDEGERQEAMRQAIALIAEGV